MGGVIAQRDGRAQRKRPTTRSVLSRTLIENLSLWSYDQSRRLYVDQPLADGIKHRLGPALDLKLAEDLSQVGLHRLFRDHKRSSDLFVTHTFGDSQKHFHLSRCKLGMSRVAFLPPQGEFLKQFAQQ